MSATIVIRLSDPKRNEYSEKAQARKKGLSTYLRDRLEREDEHIKEVVEQIADLRREIFETPAYQPISSRQPANGNTLSESDRGLLVEAVLLLRSVVAPDKVGMVHGELERLGLPILKLKS